MAEYEKRIASGELVDGDSFQVVELVLIDYFFLDSFLKRFV
jgi:hypothetical protein